ncbi:MAG TPA: MBL fold metallo-hydrolase [Peptococcaceae bacterium]|nr:MBL fold metallo-hydrolase [Peptococcaceae bacterium]
MKVEMVFEGFPGKLATGFMLWSSVVYIETKGTKILFDTAGACKRSDIHIALQKHGVAADDIDILFLSHFHEDHVYNFDYFTNARILLHAKEAEWVESEPDAWPVPKYLYPALVATGRLELIDKDVEIAPGVSTLFTPGHTPGGMSLVLRDENMPTTVVAGDAVKNLAELATGKVAMSWNNDVSAESIAKIREVAEIVIPGHDRILQLTPDKVIAMNSLHETIIIPPGVVDANNERRLELIVEQSWLPRS